MLHNLGFWTFAVATATPAYFLLYQWAQGGRFFKKTRIDGKVVIITGANTGIGRATALELAKRGGTIYLACRDMKKANEACMAIIKESGNNSVIALPLDLASFDSIRNFVQE